MKRRDALVWLRRPKKLRGPVPCLSLPFSTTCGEQIGYTVGALPLTVYLHKWNAEIGVVDSGADGLTRIGTLPFHDF